MSNQMNQSDPRKVAEAAIIHWTTGDAKVPPGATVDEIIHLSESLIEIVTSHVIDPRPLTVGALMDDLCTEWEDVLEEVDHWLNEDYPEHTLELIEAMQRALIIHNTILVCQRIEKEA